MPKYLVIAKTVSFPTLEVEAASEKEAFEIAENTDGGDFTPDYDGTWETVRAEVVECKHRNVTIKSYARYFIPQGYKALMEQDEVDMADFLEGHDSNVTVCDDCGEEID